MAENHHILYRIQVFDEGSNSFTTARSSRWVLSADAKFDTIDEAKAYIIAKSYAHTDLPLFLQQWRESPEPKRTREQVINAYLFDNPQYLKHRRFFLNNTPQFKVLQEELANIGIKMEKI